MPADIQNAADKAPAAAIAPVAAPSVPVSVPAPAPAPVPVPAPAPLPMATLPVTQIVDPRISLDEYMQHRTLTDGRVELQNAFAAITARAGMTLATTAAFDAAFDKFANGAPV